MQARCLIKNAHIVSPGEERLRGTIEIENGVITRVHSEGGISAESAVEFDAQGALVVPGFIDIHTHGAGGHDFSDGQPESLRSIAQAKLKEGVTTFLPTSMTLPQDRLRQAFTAARDYYEDQTAAKVPGVHLEGPFINPKCIGAQNPDHVRNPNWEETKELHEILPIRVLSLAVEMEGGIDLVTDLAKNGIIPSMAHTAATYEQFQKAKAAGAKHLTHYCNQMTPLHHRQIGLVGAGLLDDSIKAEMICDGVHLCPELIQLAFKVIGAERIMLITDSIAASGLGDNIDTELGGLEVQVRDGIARLPSGALAGSTLRLNQALKNVAEYTGLPLPELVGCTSYNQARSLGLTDRGKINAGFQADLVVLDDQFEPAAVFVDGIQRLAAN